MSEEFERRELERIEEERKGLIKGLFGWKPGNRFDKLIVLGALFHLAFVLGFFGLPGMPILYIAANAALCLYSFFLFKSKLRFLSIIFLILQIGFIDWITARFPVTIENPYTRYLFMKALWPWWVILGIIGGKSTEQEGVEPSKIVNFAFIFLVIAWIVMTGAGAAFVEQMAEVPYFEVAPEKIAKMGTKEKIVDIFYESIADPIACLGAFAEPGGYEKCRLERRYARHPELRPEAVSAKISAEMLASKIEFSRAEDFPSEISGALTPRHPIPTMLRILNRRANLSIVISCRFIIDGKEYGASIGPEGIEQRLAKIAPSEEQQEFFIYCTPLIDLPIGRHKAIFEARIFGLETSSILQRMVSPYDLSKDRENELIATHKGISKRQPSIAPQEFAAFSFGAGVPLSYPIIDKGRLIAATIPFGGAIQNIADGRIININSIRIRFPYGIGPGNCASGLWSFDGDALTAQAIPEKAKEALKGLSKGKSWPIISCSIDIGSLLADLEAKKIEYKPVTFSASLSYDYLVSKEFSFVVK